VVLALSGRTAPLGHAARGIGQPFSRSSHTMASVLASYESPQALRVARRLDAKIVAFLTAAAA
jgi:hypothetical protein